MTKSFNLPPLGGRLAGLVDAAGVPVAPADGNFPEGGAVLVLRTAALPGAPGARKSTWAKAGDFHAGNAIAARTAIAAAYVYLDDLIRDVAVSQDLEPEELTRLIGQMAISLHEDLANRRQARDAREEGDDGPSDSTEREG